MLIDTHAIAVAATIARRGRSVTVEGVGSVKAIFDEDQEKAVKAFPLDDLAGMGRIALFYFDADSASVSLKRGLIATDNSTGIRWQIENMADQGFPNLLMRVALVSASPMTR